MTEDLVTMNYNRANDKTWMVNIDGKYSDVIREYLINDGIPEDGVDQILQNAAKTLGYCPNPEKDDICQRTGIVIGKVQSGKTSNFISLTALAFDNGYDIVVVLGGTKKPLVKQNRERIVEYFGDDNDVVVLDTTDYRDQLNEKSIKQFTQIMRWNLSRGFSAKHNVSENSVQNICRAVSPQRMRIIGSMVFFYL